MVYIIYAITLIFALVGITELVGLIEHRIVVGKQKFHTLTLIPLRGKVENAEQIIRSAVSIRRQSRQSAYHTIVLVDCGMDAETLEICETICRDIYGLLVCEQAEVDQIVEQKLGCI